MFTDGRALMTDEQHVEMAALDQVAAIAAQEANAEMERLNSQAYSPPGDSIDELIRTFQHWALDRAVQLSSLVVQNGSILDEDEDEGSAEALMKAQLTVGPAEEQELQVLGMILNDLNSLRVIRSSHKATRLRPIMNTYTPTTT
jgi:hypothetical protein